MVKNRIKKHGFSLVEVLTATIVMSLMMIALMGYLDYGTKFWKISKTKFDDTNYARMVFDLIEEELFGATRVYKSLPVTPIENLWAASPILADTLVTDPIPPMASVTSELYYVRIINGIKGGIASACFSITRAAASDSLIRSTSSEGIAGAATTLKDTIVLVGSNDYDRNRWERVRIARNVMSFTVTRMSQQTLKVEIVFGKDTDDDGLVDEETSRHEKLFLAPQLEGTP